MHGVLSGREVEIDVRGHAIEVISQDHVVEIADQGHTVEMVTEKIREAVSHEVGVEVGRGLDTGKECIDHAVEIAHESLVAEIGRDQGVEAVAIKDLKVGRSLKIVAQSLWMLRSKQKKMKLTTKSDKLV